MVLCLCSEAINAARDGDEKAVLFARFVAPDSKTLNTQNLDRQTVLHVAAELLDCRVVRSLIANGADGAITDLWGKSNILETVTSTVADCVSSVSHA